MKRDALRKATLGRPAQNKKERVIVHIDGEPVEFYLRRPTMEQRGEIFGHVDAKNRKVDNIARLQIGALVACVCDEDGVPVFDAADVETLRNTPVCGWLEVLANEAMKYLNPDPAELGKGSGKTPSDSSSSSSPNASGE